MGLEGESAQDKAVSLDGNLSTSSGRRHKQAPDKDLAEIWSVRDKTGHKRPKFDPEPVSSFFQSSENDWLKKWPRITVFNLRQSFLNGLTKVDYLGHFYT